MTTPPGSERLTSRSASFIGAMALAGRVAERLGALAQILLIAAFLGATADADLYFVASIVPLMIGGILGEALYVSILPLLARERRGDVSELAGTGFWMALGVLTATTAVYLAIVAVVAADDLVVWIAFAPVGILLGLGAYVAAVLLELERYVWPPFRSAASALAGFLLSALALSLTDEVVWVALAVSAGYAVSLALLLVEVAAVGGRRMLRPPTRRAARELVGLRKQVAVSATGGLLGGQLFVLLERAFAASIGVGAVAAISYARGAALTPVVLGQSISLGLYPAMLRAHADRDAAYLRSRFVAGLRVTLVVAVGTAGYVWLFSDAIARFVFGRGELEGASLVTIERSLAAFSLALVGTMVLVYVSRTFNALDFFRAIVWAQGAALFAYVALALPLRFGFDTTGLALAFGVGEVVGATLAVTVAARRIGVDRGTLRSAVALPVLWRAAVLLAVTGLAAVALRELGLGSGVRAAAGLGVVGAAGALLLWFAPWQELDGARAAVRRLVRRS